MIRLGTAADIPAIVAMGHALVQESPKYAPQGYDPAKATTLCERLLAAPEHGRILVAERRGELVGMMLLAIAERFISHERFVTDVTLYLKPEARGGGDFPRMVWAAEAWAAAQGVWDLAFGVSTLVDAERTVHAYQRMGYTLSGYTLTKTLPHGD